MRDILGLVLAAGLILANAQGARAQVAPAPAPTVAMSEGVGTMPDLPPSIYAASMLPPTATYPWVMVPRFSTAATEAAGIGYGSKFSPYGLYSRYPYYATAPYPAVARPPARFEKPCGHHQCHDCR